VRNLLGTGLVELLGGILTAVFALGILMRISPVLTGLALAFVVAFALVLGRCLPGPGASARTAATPPAHAPAAARAQCSS
jgi:hypothetical protein